MLGLDEVDVIGTTISIERLNFEGLVKDETGEKCGVNFDIRRAFEALGQVTRGLTLPAPTWGELEHSASEDSPFCPGAPGKDAVGDSILRAGRKRPFSCGQEGSKPT